MEITAQKSREMVEEKIASDQRIRQETEEKYRQASESWAQKNFPKKLKSALKEIRWAAERGWANACVLRITMELREVLLAKLLIPKLQELGYDLYYEYREEHNHKCISEYCTGTKIRRYYASWGSGEDMPGWSITNLVKAEKETPQGEEN